MSIDTETARLLIELSEAILNADFATDANRELNRIFNTTLQKGPDLIGAKHGNILILDGLSSLVVKATTTQPSEDEIGTILDVYNSISGLPIIEKKTVIVPNVENHPKYQKVLIAEQMLSEIVIPLWTDNVVVGVLNFESPQLAYFNSVHRDILEIVAGLLSIAISTERAVNLRESLREIDLMILEKNMSLEGKFRKFLSICLDVIGATYGNLLLRQGTNHLVIRATTAMMSEQVVAKRVETKKSVTGKAVLQEEPIVIPDINKVPFDQRDITDESMQSELAVPIRDNNEIIGVLSVASPRRDAFNNRSAKLLEILAGQGAILLHQALDQQIAAIQQDIRSILANDNFNTHEIYEKVLEGPMEIIGAGYAQLLLVHPEYLTIEATTSQSGPGKPGTIVSFRESFCGRLVRSDKPYDISPDVRKEKEYKSLLKVPQTGAQMVSELAVKVYGGQHLIAILNFESPLEDAFNHRDAAVVQDFALSTAVALQRAIDREVEKELNEMINESGIGEISEIEWTVSVIQRLLVLLKARRGQYMKVDGKHLLIRAQFGEGLSPEGERLEIEKSVSGVAVEEKRTVLENDVARSQYANRFYGTMKGSELVVPVFIYGEVVGVFNIETERLGGFTERHAKIVEEVASIVSLNLYLRQVGENVKSVFHNSKNKLAQIRNVSKELSDTFERDPNFDEEDLYSLRDIYRLSSDLFKAAVRVIDPPNLWPILILDFTKNYIASRQAEGQRKDIQIICQWGSEINERTVVLADETKLTGILDILVDNSIRELSKLEKSDKLIQFNIVNDSDHILVIVEDNANGIDPSRQSREELFGEGLSHDKNVQGSGIGLPDANRMVHQMQGKIDLKESRVGVGTQMQVTLKKIGIVCVCSNTQKANPNNESKYNVYILGRQLVAYAREITSGTWFTLREEKPYPVEKIMLTTLDYQPTVLILDLSSEMVDLSMDILQKLQAHKNTPQSLSRDTRPYGLTYPHLSVNSPNNLIRIIKDSIEELPKGKIKKND